MAYIGQQGGVTATITSKTLDTMTGDGSDTTLTLSQTPTSAEDVSIYADGVYQRPTNEYTVSGDVVTFTTAPASGVFVCAVTGGGHHIGSPMGGSVSTSKIIDGTITNAMVATMSSSKLTGAIAAVDGSALTGIPSSIMKNASDPAINTNPSGGLGTVWANTTDGEMFVCTDATTDENVWYNVGGGTGDVAPYSFQGTISGYTSGGDDPHNIIDKFSFSSDGNATDVGDMTIVRYQQSGQSSTTHGYNSAGYYPTTDVIDKFTFAADADATDVGDLTVARYDVTGQSSSTHGYTSGGTGPSNVIDKFSFTTDGNATDVGDLTVARQLPAGQSSSTHGYTSGGGNPYRSVIDKFSFSVDGNATDVGDLTVARGNMDGQSSTTHGYTAGGSTAGGGASDNNTIEKFSFATDGNATDIGDLTRAIRNTAGQSSTTHGYASGGNAPNTTVIDKFSFTTDGNATDIGDLTVARYGPAGQQY